MPELPVNEGCPPLPIAEKASRRQRKLRAAWVSFVGRIVAQIVGAVATVALAITILRPGPEPVTSLTPENRGRTEIVVTRRVSNTGRPAVAVLPLETIADQERQEYIADSLRSLIIAKLAESDALAVVSATSSARFAGRSAAAREIGDNLGVQHLLEGTVTTLGGRVRVNLQLVNALSDEIVWAAAYQEPLADVFAFESRLAAATATAVQRALAGSPAESAPTRTTATPTFATTVTLEP